MLAATYHVTIERHEVGPIPALTFQCGASTACPLVFALHGLTSRKERHLELCLRLADAGFRACSFDVRSHGERRDETSSVLFGDRYTPEFAFAFAETVFATIEDMGTLASYFGAERYAVVGHSMGGFIALHSALADPRVAAVANVSGAIDVSPLLAGATPEFAELLRRADVAARAEHLAPRPVLLSHGEEDQTVPVHGANRLAAALKTAYGDDAGRVTLRLYPEFGHEFRPQLAADAVEWLVANFAG